MNKVIRKYKQEEYLLEEMRRKYRFKCKCGWLNTIYPFEKKVRKVCKNCGHYVYINRYEEFKGRLKERLK